MAPHAHAATLTAPGTGSRLRLTTIALWVLQIATAAVFLTAAPGKLAGDPTAVQAFEAIGIGQWFRYLTGLIETFGAVLLFVPSLAAYAAVALAITMVGAVATHLFILGGSPLLALAMLATTTTIAWARWNR